MENWFQRSMSVYEGFGWLQRPLMLVIIALIVLTLYFSVRGIIKAKRSEDAPETGEGAERNPLLSLPLTIALTGIFVWAYFESQQWPSEVNQFPIAIAVPGAVLALAVLYFDIRAAFRFVGDNGGLTGALTASSQKAVLGSAGIFFLYLLAVLLATLVVGQVAALVGFIGLYLWRWGGYGWKVSIGYAVAGWLLLYIFYDWVMSILWHPSLLSDFYGAVIERFNGLFG